MILYPLYTIRITSLDLLIFSDHVHPYCGHIYKLTENHSNQTVTEVALQGLKEREAHINACYDLEAYVSAINKDPSITESKRPGKKAAFATAAEALSVGILDNNHPYFRCGVEVDPETMLPSYWLYIDGFQSEIRYPLMRFEGSLK